MPVYVRVFSRVAAAEPAKRSAISTEKKFRGRPADRPEEIAYSNYRFCLIFRPSVRPAENAYDNCRFCVIFRPSDFSSFFVA